MSVKCFIGNRFFSEIPVCRILTHWQRYALYINYQKFRVCFNALLALQDCYDSQFGNNIIGVR